MGIIFISGKISELSVKEYTENFEHWEKYFKDLGYTVYNPVQLCESEYERLKKLGKSEKFIWVELLKLCLLTLVGKCDTAFFMDNYVDSDGAKVEYFNAVKLNHRIIYEREVVNGGR